MFTQSPFGEVVARQTGFLGEDEDVDLTEVFALETVICADLDEDGDDEMLVHYVCCTVSSPSPLGIFEQDAQGNWQLRWTRVRGAVFRVEDDDGIPVATEPVYSKRDSNCCRSRLRDLRLGWDGRQYGVLSSRVRPAPSS